MSALKHTQTRHIVLRLVEPGDTVETHVADVKKLTRKYRATRGVLGGAEARTLKDLRQAGLLFVQPMARIYAPERVSLSQAGRALLAQWDEQYGEVKA